jgi:alpha-tubulin suppressor-like RCC1 family protein
LGQRRAGVLLLVLGFALAWAAITSASRAAAEGSAAVAWGENNFGTLGAIYKDNLEATPIGVQAPSNISTLALGGGFTIALLESGAGESWGVDKYGQLGDGGFLAPWERSLTHVTVAGLEHAKAITAGIGGGHALALLENGNVEAWGSNTNGALGNGKAGFEPETGEPERTPKVVKNLEPGKLGEERHVIAIAGGAGSNYALLENHHVLAWGENQVGQLGIELPAECHKTETAGCGEFECKAEQLNICSKIPSEVTIAPMTPLKEVETVVAGAESAYALLKNGHVLAWGANNRGQLGTGGPTNKGFQLPTEVLKAAGGTLTEVQSIYAGYNHVLVVLKNGSIYGWGDNERSALGEQGTQQECSKRPCEVKAVPIPTTGLPAEETPESISAGNNFTLFLYKHRIYAMGYNDKGRLGIGTTEGPQNCQQSYDKEEQPCSKKPVLIESLEHVKSIFASNTFSEALLQSGFEPPGPAVKVEPGKETIKLSWKGTEPKSVRFREFEHGEEEGGEESEEEAGQGTGEAREGGPRDETLPRVKLKKVKPETPGVQVGDALEGTTGVWTGTAKIKFKYEWKRCRAGTCEAITGASGTFAEGETSTSYTLIAADIRHYLEIAVTAENEVAKKTEVATAESQQSEIVKPTGKRFLFLGSTSVAGVESFTLKEIEFENAKEEIETEKLVHGVQYDLRLLYSGGKAREVVAQPE